MNRLLMAILLFSHVFTIAEAEIIVSMDENFSNNVEVSGEFLKGIQMQSATEKKSLHVHFPKDFKGDVYIELSSIDGKYKADIKAEIKAYQEELVRDAENTTLARFIRNLESRIYAELSRQLVNNLFGETASTGGIIELEGNTIEYTIDGDFITLTITDADGNVTEITLPVGDFYF
jgi:hypothetical protein